MAGDTGIKAALVKTRLVKLLMQKPPLDSADAWAHALSLLEAECGCAPQSQQLNLLPAAIQELVPRLPEYKTVRIALLALLEYCQDRYPVETDTCIEIWLERAFAVTSMAAFRRWLVEWLHAAYAVPQSRWMKALQAALVSMHNLTEEDWETKRMLLQMLHRLKGTADDEVTGEDAVTQAQAITTVEELLDFYWHHADALATSALLCAAKLNALLDSTVATQDRLNLNSTVSARLRWAVVTKPLLFESLMLHATALKAFRGGTDSIGNLRLSAELQAVMDCVGPLQLTRLQDMYERTMATLKSASQHGVKHLHQIQDTVHCPSPHDAALRKLLAQWSPQVKEKLVADLANDLALVSPYLVSAVFTPFSVYLSTLLLGEATEERGHAAEEALVAAVNALFQLLKRLSDATICYLVLAIVLHSRLVQHGVWRRQPCFFSSVIQSLSECLALENDRERRWIVTMTLQQFLFECNADVLRVNRSQIIGLVPQELERLIHIRLQ